MKHAVVAAVLISGNGFDLRCLNSAHTNPRCNLVHPHVQKEKTSCESGFLSAGLKHLSAMNVSEFLDFCEYSCSVSKANSSICPIPPPHQDCGNANRAPEIDL